MSKKMIQAISLAIIMITGGICAVGYAVGNSSFPWWLIPFAGVIAGVIFMMFGNVKEENDKDKKHKKMIGAVCASISMISVLIFIAVMMLTNFANSWIIVMIGGIASGIVYTIDNAMHSDKK